MGWLQRQAELVLVSYWPCFLNNVCCVSTNLGFVLSGQFGTLYNHIRYLYNLLPVRSCQVHHYSPILISSQSNSCQLFLFVPSHTIGCDVKFIEVYNDEFEIWILGLFSTFVSVPNKSLVALYWQNLSWFVIKAHMVQMHRFLSRMVLHTRNRNTCRSVKCKLTVLKLDFWPYTFLGVGVCNQWTLCDQIKWKREILILTNVSLCIILRTTNLTDVSKYAGSRM